MPDKKVERVDTKAPGPKDVAPRAPLPKKDVKVEEIKKPPAKELKA